MGRHNNEMTSQQRENDETEADSQNQFYEQEHGANLPRMRTEESGLNAATGEIRGAVAHRPALRGSAKSV